jgi:DNA-binding transcriptional regulator YdaS (Cro superfamily)
MLLATWAALRGWGALSWLARESGVTYPTVHAIARGARRASYKTAIKLSEATGGAVTVAELCESPQPPKQKEPKKHGNTKAPRKRQKRSNSANSNR